MPALVPWRGRAPWTAAALGVLLVMWQGQSRLAERWPVERHGEDVEVRGVVASLPERGGLAQRFLFEPEREDVPPRIRVAWYRGPVAVRGGECWTFTLRLRTPHGSLNPGGFDYEAWLFRQGIGATATVRDGRSCGVSAGYPVQRARQWLVDRLEMWVREPPARALVAALTVGDRSGFTDRDWDSFRLTGTTHLVAISGFNVAIVAAAAFFLFRWLWSSWPRLCLRVPAQRAGLLGSAVLSAFYALLAGFEPPVQRAVIMLWIVLAALWVHRRTEASRVLAIAWFAVLALDPFAVLSPGLWLSFGAVAAIFYVSLGRSRAPGFWHGAVLLQLLLAVALAPMTLFFFQGASWAAPAVNLLAVPFFAVLTPWVFAAVILAGILPAAGVPLLGGAAWLLGHFRSLLDDVSQWPGLWIAASPPEAVLLLSLIGIVLLFAPRGLPLRPLGLLCLLPALLPPPQDGRPDLELAALDVGQGLAVVVRTPNHALLYDAGPAFDEGFDAGRSVVAPYLLHQGLRRLDVLLQSHGDNDHAGGVEAVRDLAAIDRVLGADGARACGAPQSWTWDGIRFEVLHPDGPPWAGNDASCVLKVSGPFSVLLAGDIEARAERHLVRERGADLRADVLIAPHHGSRTSSTPEFVRAVNPEIVVYGAGWKNHFRHPRPEVQQRYAAIGARQFITGNSGAVAVTRDGDGTLQVREWRRDARRFWNTEVEN